MKFSVHILYKMYFLFFNNIQYSETLEIISLLSFLFKFLISDGKLKLLFFFIYQKNCVVESIEKPINLYSYAGKREIRKQILF